MISSDSIPSAQPSYNPSAQSTPWGYDYTRVRSNTFVSYTGFNGDIEFNINASESERWISTKNSYLSARLRIVMTDEAGNVSTLQPIVNAGVSRAAATKVSIPYISPNPAGCLFSAVACDIKEENVSLNQNIGQTNTLFRTLYESKSENETINNSNPIKYMNFADVDTTENKGAMLTDYFTGYPNGLTNFSGHKLFALKNMMGFNKYYEVEVNTQLMAPLFYSDDMIPPNTPLTLRYTVDNNFFTNLISIAGSNFSSLGAPYTITKLESPFPTAGTINTIAIGVVDLNLWLYRVHMPDVVSIPKEINIKQFDSVLHPITAGTHDEFNVSFKKNRRVTHIALAFVQKKANIKTTTTDFSSGFCIGAGVTANGVTTDTSSAVAITEDIVYSNSPIFQLSNIRIEYAGAVYPFQPYNINFDHTNRSAGGNVTPYVSGNNQRIYYDYCNFSDQLRDRSGALLSQEQHQISPIFIWKTFQNPNNDDNGCTITLDFKSGITGCNCIVVGYYDETFQLMYNDQGKYDRLGRLI